MTETADAVVVGAGVNGAAAAYHLVTKGLRDVLVVDRAGVAEGTTGASSSVVRQHYGHETTARMALDSLKFFESFHERTGGDAGFTTCGAVIVGSQAALPTIESVVAMQQRVGIRTGMITPDDLADLEPEMRADDLAGGAFEPDAGYADPIGTASGLINAAVRGGARCWLNTALHRIVTDRERVVAVDTERGRVATARVILAAGPWTVPIVKGLGIELPVKTSRHPVLIFEHPGGNRPSHIIFDLVQIMYSRPDGAALTLVGTLDIAHSQDESDPDNFDRQPTLDEVATWGEMLTSRFPAYSDVVARRGWCGIYEYTPDWHHIIDELPTARGCWIVCGTSGHGFKLGPAVGDIVSDMALGRTPKYQVADFGLDRYSQGRDVTNRYAETIIG